AGSAPSRARTMSTSARFAQISSCSTAAARKVSAAQISGRLPWFLSRLASLPTVVVFPVPLTPTIKVTCGRAATAIGRSTAAKTLRISCFTRSRRLALLRDWAWTAAMIRLVAATPMSAEISSSSSASTVSTSTGRDRFSGASAARTISSKRSTICLVVRESPSRRRPKNPIAPILSCLSGLCLRALFAQHQHADRRTHVGPAAQDLGHLRRDRELDAVALAEREGGAGRHHPFGDHLHAGQDLGKRAAAR